MHGYYYVDMMGNLPHSIVALIDLLINFRVHLFDDDHLISDECHAPLILLAQQVPINFSHLHQQRYEAARSWPLWKTQRFYPSHEGRTHHKKAREGKHRVGTDTLAVVEAEAEVALRGLLLDDLFKVTLVTS